MESKVSFLASIFFSARRFISSLPLYFRSSHTYRFVAKFLKNFFLPPLSGRQGSAYYTSPNRFASSGTSFPSLALSPLSCALCFALLRRGGESYQHFRRCQTLFSRQSDILLLSDNNSIPFSLKYKANYALCAVTDLTGGRRTRRRFLWKNSSSDENTTLSRTSGAGSSPACCKAI